VRGVRYTQTTVDNGDNVKKTLTYSLSVEFCPVMFADWRCPQTIPEMLGMDRESLLPNPLNP